MIKRLEINVLDMDHKRCSEMFGLSPKGMQAMIDNCTIGDAHAIQFLAMSILSDAQHVMESNPETSRQFMNKAKFLMSEVMTELRNH